MRIENTTVGNKSQCHRQSLISPDWLPDPRGTVRYSGVSTLEFDRAAPEIRILVTYTESSRDFVENSGGSLVNPADSMLSHATNLMNKMNNVLQLNGLENTATFALSGVGVLDDYNENGSKPAIGEFDTDPNSSYNSQFGMADDLLNNIEDVQASGRSLLQLVADTYSDRVIAISHIDPGTLEISPTTGLVD